MFSANSKRIWMTICPNNGAWRLKAFVSSLLSFKHLNLDCQCFYNVHLLSNLRSCKYWTNIYILLPSLAVWHTTDIGSNLRSKKDKSIQSYLCKLRTVFGIKTLVTWVAIPCYDCSCHPHMASASCVVTGHTQLMNHGSKRWLQV